MNEEDGYDAQAPAEGGRNAGLQVVSAAALGAVVLAGMWGLGVLDGDSGARDDKPAACEAPKATDSPEYPALCAALNRPDLPALLGTPKEHVSIAQSAGGVSTFPDGTKETDASAQVQIGPVNVQITDNRDVPAEGYLELPGLSARRTTVLGRSAVAFSDHTMAIVFNGRSSSTGTGGIAQHLVVPKGGPRTDGGSFEIAVWRQDGAAPDEAALLRIAETVLPTAPGWAPGE